MSRFNEDSVSAGIAGVGCFFMLLWLAFWGTVIYVAWHFISKFW